MPVGSLVNQMAIVSGASSGIGRAIALGLAQEGASLCLLGRNKDRLLETARTAEKNSPKVAVYQTDLSCEADLASLVRRLDEEVEYIDVIVNAAGALMLGEMVTSPINNLDRQYKVNVRAPYLLTQTLLPRVKARRGQIVFINSSVGIRGSANVGQYAATKHALKAIADSLRDEVNPDGVRILNIFAGRTASAMQETVHHLEGKTYDPQSLLQPEDITSVVINALTLPRTAEVTEIHIRPLRKS
jgi:NADP-dependent 3-hydroxy acid dehydrogenase YdfG